MKKFLIILLFLSFIKTASGYAVEMNSSRIARLEKEVEELQEKLHELLVEQARPSANPSIIGDVYFVTFDVLYWYARTNGTQFAYSNSATSAAMPLKGRTKDIDFTWEWGLRAGIGKNLDHDKWDLYASFTLYRPHSSGGTNAGRNSTLIPLKGATVINAGVKRARSTYALDTYQIDAELGRHYFVSSKLSFRPFASVKNAWLKQKQIVRYTGGSVGNNTAHVEDHCDFWGIGLRGGINSKWHLGEGVYLEGLFAGALLYGYFDIDHREKLTANPHDTIQLDDNKHRFVPTMQWRFGIGWGTYFNDRKNHLDFEMAYEGQYWWRLNQMINIYEYNAFRYESLSDDVSMHGLTLMVKLYF